MVKIKRVYDPPLPGDGKRILVDRLWPRGIKKTEAHVDEWLKDIAPSNELRAWYGHEPAKWQEFRSRYLKELRNNPELVTRLKQEGKKGTLTLLFAAKDSEHSNAAVLKELLSRKTASSQEVTTMKSTALKAAALLLGMFVLFAGPDAFAAKKAGHAGLTPKAVELKLAMRDLWVGHIFWVRNVVLETKAGNTEAAKVAEGKVVEDARAIADAIVPIYGKDAGDKLFGLLAGHYGAVKGYMITAFANDEGSKGASVGKIRENAEEIAVFLNSANPKNWPKDTLMGLLIAHGVHHVAQIDQVNSKDVAAEARTWDDMKNHIYTIADVLADGIVKQFPKKF
jgi:uncharacterized protein YeaO (DUF488 family)